MTDTLATTTPTREAAGTGPANADASSGASGAGRAWECVDVDLATLV